jgi:protein-S-isoprenylcysteine O-methyltransferase Ste14
MSTEPEPRGAQARGRLRDVGVVLALLGFFGVWFPPPTHARAILHNVVYLASALVMLAGAALLTLWAILAARSNWRSRRERSRRGFAVLDPKNPKSDTISA